MISAQTCDYRPSQREVVLSTDFTQIQPFACPPFNVTGGVFVFRDIDIADGVTVRGVGTRPMIWVATGDVRIDGTLCVDGTPGERVTTLASANFPSAGGVGGAAGGRGGNGSPSASGPSMRGQFGQGPMIGINLGGHGGRMSCSASCGRASGGGGGAYTTAGDPHYPLPAALLPAFAQREGIGGYGCIGSSGAGSRRLPGGNAGVLAFADSRLDNDFFGVGLNVFRQELVQGELLMPLGGAGGGGGGDASIECGPNPRWLLDAKGGGGGGGGGILIIVAAGKIEIGETGSVTANGGNGGGGEQAGSNNKGGGGGGGSGGMVVLYSLDEVLLHTHGETFANGDFDFAVAADGGIGEQGIFGGSPFEQKYPPPAAGSGQIDANPSGGFGGMGLVQIMTRPGMNADGTNTILDDNITILHQGIPLAAQEKERFLAWRGVQDEALGFIDDFGQPTYAASPATEANEGDIRPAPILLPIL